MAEAPETIESGTKRPRGTGAASVYRELRKEILTLALEPGTLLDESELSERFNISRSPVREALIRLGSEGLVRTLPNRSPIVSFCDVSEIIGFFDAIDLMYRSTARLAAMTATADDCKRLDEMEARHLAAGESGVLADIIQTNQDFHNQIAQIGGNPFLITWLQNALDTGQRIMYLYMQHNSDAPSSYARGAHHTLVQAIFDHDPNAAEKAARADAAIASDHLAALLRRRAIGGVSLQAKRR
jgi:DNA-binding GntR family transcriptional regulator